jgi:tetratricopeptide (TPR) repeat protein
MMGISRRATAALCVSLLVAAPVAAQGPTPTPQQKQAAGDLTKQAIAKSQAGDHEKAIELYLQAYEIVPLAILYTNVGAEYQKLKRPADAWKYFCMYLEKDPKGPSSDFATTQAKAMQHEMGNHDVTDANVCEPPKPPEPVTPVAPVVETRQVAPPASTDRGKSLRIAGLVVGGAGVVSLGVGVFFGIKAKQISDEITDHPMNMMWPDDIQDLEARGEAHEKKQIIFMIAGGAAVATGVALYLIGRSRKSSDEQHVTLVPTASPESAGLAITGGF